MTSASYSARRPGDVPSTPMPDAAPFPRGGRDALPPGTVLDDAYRIERVLGQGGFGIVYLATDLTLQRPTAVKEYLPVQLAGRGEGTGLGLREPAHKEAFLRGLHSFLREARMLAQFDHPSLVRVYRFWEENHTAYMAMPYYEGQTLKAARARMQRPPEEGWLRDGLLLPLLGALQTLHAANCLHRDVSPGNILLCDDGRAVLLDFGSARRVVGDMTQPLTTIVNPQYAAIEQYAESPSLAQGPWTDLYGLAAVAYHALTGRPPVPATVRAVNDAAMPTMAEVAASIARTFPSLRYGAPLLATLDRALALRPADRPQSAAEMREALIRPHVQPDVTIEGPPLQVVPPPDEITLFDTAPAQDTQAPAEGHGKGADGEPLVLDADEEQAMRQLVSAALGDIGQWPPMARNEVPHVDPVLLPPVPPRDRAQSEFAAAREALAGFGERRGPPLPGKVTLKVVPGGHGDGAPVRREPVLHEPAPAETLAPEQREAGFEPIEQVAPAPPAAEEWTPESDESGRAAAAAATPAATPETPPLATRFDPGWEVTRPSVASVPIHPVQPLAISSLHVDLPPTPVSAPASPAASEAQAHRPTQPAAEMAPEPASGPLSDFMPQPVPAGIESAAPAEPLLESEAVAESELVAAPEPAPAPEPVAPRPEPVPPRPAPPQPVSAAAPAVRRPPVAQPPAPAARAGRAPLRDPQFIDDAWADTLIAADPTAEPPQAANEEPPRRGRTGAWRWVAAVAGLGLLGWAGWHAAGTMDREPVVAQAPKTAPVAVPSAGTTPSTAPAPTTTSAAPTTTSPAPAAPAPPAVLTAPTTATTAPVAPAPTPPVVVAAVPTPAPAPAQPPAATQPAAPSAEAPPPSGPTIVPTDPATVTSAATAGGTAPDTVAPAADTPAPTTAAVPAAPPTRVAQSSQRRARPGDANTNSSGTSARNSGRTPSTVAKGDGSSTRRAPVRTASATPRAPQGPADPRAACGSRTNFSLLYCMRAQCRTAKFTAHPQCQRMRLNGDL